MSDIDKDIVAVNLLRFRLPFKNMTINNQIMRVTITMIYFYTNRFIHRY